MNGYLKLHITHDGVCNIRLRSFLSFALFNAFYTLKSYKQRFYFKKII